MMEKCGMKLSAANPGQRVLTGIEERISSEAGHPYLAAQKGERGKWSVMK
jgi:hypothetical protein